ncbi:MAG: hypothetical protein GEV28_24850 [Actinophytocola sp.]|uniref:hypothetical protein n=1 Tax=Actinophytocola sp. TaxID=1872138 RepID=UPI001329C858|nr:hypothetical protein [Actinophytocola sp.]MPZ83443.1 hypothetical protein [Actinophytocola sp.]
MTTPAAERVLEHCAEPIRPLARAVRTVGSVQLALVSGLMIQWLTDATEVLTGLRTLLGADG